MVASNDWSIRISECDVRRSVPSAPPLHSMPSCTASAYTAPSCTHTDKRPSPSAVLHIFTLPEACADMTWVVIESTASAKTGSRGPR